jgi:hypothetical protein
MEKTRNIVRVAMCTAMLLGGQVALTSVSGVEIVTVLLLCFCYCYGARTGIAIATTFSLVRCFVFGFYINIIALYLIYYNLFALFFGWLGTAFRKKGTWLELVTVVAAAMVFTVLFTMLDNVITPLIFAFHKNAAAVYFAQSLYALVPQTICTMATVSILFVPLTKILQKIS